jgi:hypothetical protein
MPRTAMNPRQKLLSLVAAHLVGGHLIARPNWFGLYPSEIETFPGIYLQELFLIPTYAMMLSGPSLLAFFAAFFVEIASWKRYLGLIIGSIYLDWLFIGAVGSLPQGCLLSFAIAVVLIAVRHVGIRLIPLASISHPTSDAGYRASIRNLMVLISVFAVYIIGTVEMRHSLLLLISMDILTCTLVALASLWASLGVSRPLEKAVLVLALSITLGFLFAHGIDGAIARGYFQSAWRLYIFVVTVVVLQAAILVSSFLVVRSCDYRLVG